jgi:hypothetical protein
MHKGFLTAAPQLRRSLIKATVLPVVPSTASNNPSAKLPCLLVAHPTGFLETPALLRLIFFLALT